MRGVDKARMTMRVTAAICSAIALYACGSANNAQATLYGPTYTVAAASSITPSTACSRTSGNAPLAVYFSAFGTVSTLTSPASNSDAGFHQIKYTWNFGDSTSTGTGTWANGSSNNTNSMNAHVGPEAAHVYGSAGTYTVQLTAYDGTNTSTTNACVITVSAWPSDTTTTCVAALTTPVAGVDGCPSGAAVAQQSNINTIASTYLGDNKRVLLKHDDTFTGTAGGPVLTCNHCEVNMYGTGAKPISSVQFQYSAGATPTDDMRVANVDFENLTSTTIPAINIYSNSTYVQDVLIYNSTYHTCASDTMDSNVSTTGPNTGIFIVGNTFSGCGGVGSEGIHALGQNIAIIGNSETTNSTAQHPIRLQYGYHVTINNNSIIGGGSTKEMIAFRTMANSVTGTGSAWIDGHTGNFSHYADISDNNFDLTSGYAFVVLGGGQDATAHDYDVIVERNFGKYESGTTANNGWDVQCGEHVSVRNNVINMSFNAGQTGSALNITLDTNCAATDTVDIYNNTFYRGNDTTGFTGTITAGTGTTNVVIDNNLAYYPFSAGGSWVSCGTGCTAATNTGNVGTLTTSPSFSNGSTTFSLLSDFKPTAASYPIGAGTTVSVWADAVGAAEPSPRDIGAVNH